MIRIGLVDLDTSHPQAFTTILKSMSGVEVAALCDHGDVWPEGYDRRFARANGIPNVCRDPEEMVPLVDAAMVHSVNWDVHVDRALPFLKAGKPVLIDKPVVGSLRDCMRLEALRAEFGGIVFGGSSLRFAGEVMALKGRLAGAGGAEAAGGMGREPAGAVLSVYANGPGDFFSYGIHTTEMAQAILGSGATEVEYIGGSRSTIIAVTYKEGPVLILQLGLPVHDWTLAVYTEVSGMIPARVDPAGLYPPFLRAFLHTVGGREQADTVALALEAVKIHLAADMSRRIGRRVLLDELAPDAAFDGAAFAAEYAAGKKQSAGS